MLTTDTILNNRYQILRMFSDAGGMGLVYQATDLNLRSTVIVKQSRCTEKFLRDNHRGWLDEDYAKTAAELRKAFEREARLLNGLRHNALPRVIDYFFIEDAGQFIVMEFIPGKDFSELLKERREERQGAFPPEQVMNWADQLLEVLEYLHAHEPPIIHRDIKPANLKLMPNGQIVLLDFGLAKGAVAGMSVVAGSNLGHTPLYAPLEQINRKGTDARSDLYSLAVTLHHLLTGQAPIDAVARVTETISGDPDLLRPAHEINPQVPKAVSVILQQAAAVAQKDRLASATVMRAALRQAAQPVIAPPVIIIPPVVPDILDEPETIIRPASQAFIADLGKNVKLEMMTLPGGTFTMGSNDYDDEKPPHQVNVSAFSIGKYQVTQAQYQAVMGTNPSNFKGEDRPVEQVSWNDAVDFCKKLSAKTGKTYRLPTEAEWEYACRAGNSARYSFGDDVGLLEQYAWYDKNSDRQTHPVGQKKPNAFGLYDMSGNVWEWCQDWYGENYYKQSPPNDPLGPSSGTRRVLRGGSWVNYDNGCRSAYRYDVAPGDRGIDNGFRVVVSARTQ